jgi:hypothetical protein
MHASPYTHMQQPDTRKQEEERCTRELAEVYACLTDRAETKPSKSTRRKAFDPKSILQRRLGQQKKSQKMKQEHHRAPYALLKPP